MDRKFSILMTRFSYVIQCLTASKLHARGLFWKKNQRTLKRRHGIEKYVTRGRVENPVTWEGELKPVRKVKSYTYECLCTD